VLGDEVLDVRELLKEKGYEGVSMIDERGLGNNDNANDVLGEEDGMLSDGYLSVKLRGEAVRIVVVLGGGC